MNCFTDPDLAGYRLFAAARVVRFGAHGFPVQPGTGRRAAVRRVSEDASHRAARGWARALTAMAGAVIAAVTATALCRYFGQEASHGSRGVVAAPPGARSPRPSPAPPGNPGGSRPVSAALPLGAPEVAGPAAVLGGLPPKDFLWAPGAPDLNVSPGRLTLPAGGAGAITLTSGSDAVQWRTSGTGPVRVSPSGGTLEPGVAQIITVQAPPNGPGAAVITFWPGGRQVEVAWGARPSPPPPPPPSPTPTPTPTTPSPTEPPPTEPPPAEPPPTKPAPTEPVPATPPISAPSHSAPPSPAVPPPSPSEQRRPAPSSGPGD
jgi:hypothetical protein